MNKSNSEESNKLGNKWKCPYPIEVDAKRVKLEDSDIKEESKEETYSKSMSSTCVKSEIDAQIKSEFISAEEIKQEKQNPLKFVPLYVYSKLIEQFNRANEAVNKVYSRDDEFDKIWGFILNNIN